MKGLELLNDDGLTVLTEKAIKARYNKEYFLSNKKKLTKQKHEYYVNKREYFREYHYNYNRKNKDKIKEKNHRLYLKNREKAIQHSIEFHKIQKLRRYEVLAHYSNGVPQCACCGELEYLFLTIDHINGRKELGHTIKQTKFKFTGVRLTSWLRRNNYPDGFQVLCFNCNSGRELNNRICPHQKRKPMLNTKSKRTDILASK